MKLLIVTQKVDKNDPILGFFHRWIIEFAKHVESIVVICLEEGKHELPHNVRVLSLGKEMGHSRLKYISLFYKYIWRERGNYDKVFVHMNQVYVVLGGLFWRLWDKGINLWYSHKSVEISLQIAVLLSDHIFTAARESFNIKTDKLNIVGHGIDIGQFMPINTVVERNRSNYSIVSIGRITRIKNLDTLIETVGILRKQGFDCSCRIIGPQVTVDDKIYFEELQKLVHDRDLSSGITFIGGVVYKDIKDYYWNSNVNINLTPTGGIDKVVLEGIVGGSVPMVSNKAFETLFGKYAVDLIFPLRDPHDLAQKIIDLKKKDSKEIIDYLRTRVSKDFSIEGVVNKIISIIK